MTARNYCLLAFLCAAPLNAQDALPLFTADAATRTTGTLLGLTDDGAIHLQSAGMRLSLPRLIELRQDQKNLPPRLTRNFVSLSNGDRLPLDADAAAILDNGRLRLWPHPALPGFTAKNLNLFAANVVLLFWSLPDGVDDPERFFAQLQDEPRKRDAVYLKNGDHLEGAVIGLDGKTGCTLDIAGRKVQTAWSKLAGIAFNTDRLARLRTKKAYYRAVLDGGARVNFVDMKFEDKPRRFVGKTQFGVAFEIPESSLLALDVCQGPAVVLAEQTPARYEHRPFLGASWALAKDAAATGGPLCLAGDTFEDGIGMHAPSQVSYKLDGKFERFHALVGIDAASKRGRAKVALELDGKRIDLHDGKELTIQNAPLLIRQDVTGVRRLTLIVDVGSFGDVQADINWAKARLVKKGI